MFAMRVAANPFLYRRDTMWVGLRGEASAAIEEIEHATLLNRAAV
jgi:hypothetical protein